MVPVESMILDTGPAMTVVSEEMIPPMDDQFTGFELGIIKFELADIQLELGD